MSDRPVREGLLLPVLIPVGALILIGLVLFGFSRVLLSTSHAAATWVALVVAAAIVAVAAVIASRKRQPNGALFSLFGVVAGIAMVSGGVAVMAFAPSEEEEAAVVALAAPVGAAVDGFAQTSLSVPAERPLTIEFDNQDVGIQHNVVIFDGEDEGAPVLFDGEVSTGPTTTPYAVEPVAIGSYFFHCEVHPTTMTGTIEAAEVAGEGGEGGPVVSASNLEFDTDVIQLPADQAAAITFDNQDPAVVHNISIFQDDSLAQNLFDGPDITGPAEATYEVPALPAGTYYFHCDTHPAMAGDVVVEGGGGGEPPGGEGGGGGAGSATGSSGSTGPSG
jgi:plastocyanin